MIEVTFEDKMAVENRLLKYAVIVSRYQDKWVFSKHRDRDTWEIPGGTREPGEAILDTANRELYEETGALGYQLTPICAYCVTSDSKSYGLLCYADISSLGQLPPSEISQIQLFDEEPATLTYPLIQPFLFAKVKSWLAENASPTGLL